MFLIFKISRFCRIPRIFFNFPKPRLNRLQMPILLSRLLFGIGKRLSFKPKFRRKGINRTHLRYENQSQQKVHESTSFDQSLRESKEIDSYGSPISPIITNQNDNTLVQLSNFVPVYYPEEDEEESNNGFNFESDKDDHNNQNLKFKPSPTDLNLIEAFNEISETEQMFVEENQIIQKQQGAGKDPGEVYFLDYIKD